MEVLIPSQRQIDRMCSNHIKNMPMNTDLQIMQMKMARQSFKLGILSMLDKLTKLNKIKYTRKED